MEEVPRVELVTFSCRECVVYMIPPASTVGHRAELWDVENPLQVAGQTPGRFHTLSQCLKYVSQISHLLVTDTG